MANETILDVKKAFIQGQLRLLATPFSLPRDWQTRTSDDSNTRLPDRVIADAIYQLNQKLRVHNLAAFSAQAVRHVAESLDTLYWAESEPEQNEDLGEALERGRDFRIDAHAEALPLEWPEEVYEDETEEAEKYQELQERLMELLERRKETRQRLENYQKLKSLLEPFQNPVETVQPNLVTKGGELATELERMRGLLTRISGRIGVIQGSSTSTPEEDPGPVNGEEKLDAIFDTW